MHWGGKEKSLPKSVLECLDSCDREYFPLIHKILHIFATLPVTTAQGERCFSGMRRIKTFLRSSMSEDRFTGLSHISLNKDIEIPTGAVTELCCVSFE